MSQKDESLLYSEYQKPVDTITKKHAHKIAKTIQNEMHQLLERRITETPRIVPISKHITSFLRGKYIAQETVRLLEVHFKGHALLRLCKFLILPPEAPINKWEVTIIIDLHREHNRHFLSQYYRKIKKIIEEDKKHKAYIKSLDS